MTRACVLSVLAAIVALPGLLAVRAAGAAPIGRHELRPRFVVELALGRNARRFLLGGAHAGGACA